MKARLTVALAALAAAAALDLPAATRETQRCNRAETDMVWFDVATAETMRRIVDAASPTTTDTALRDKLWTPARFDTYVYRAFPEYGNVVLHYDPWQDVIEIAESMRADPSLAQLGVLRPSPNSYACFLAPPPSFVTAVEWHNERTGHYFMSADAGENAAIEAGAAGPGWKRTGETLRVDKGPQGDCVERLRVQRLYAPRANTHFFTLGPDECGGLKRDPEWLREGTAFYAIEPVSGSCAGSRNPTPVYRLYNNRAAQNDSNHRFVTRPAVVEQMKAQGWIAEGVAFCAPPQ